MYGGDDDIARSAAELAERLPTPLAPLARIAHNYAWCWSRDGSALFGAIDPPLWARSGHNPVSLLQEARPAVLRAAAADPAIVERVRALDALIDADLARPARSGVFSPEHPVAFMCAEFGVHRSLPVYSGGLGVLAGDILKEASDLAVPMVGVGLMYRSGYFHQRLDVSGFQHEYWIDTAPERLPAARVTGPDGSPLRLHVPVDDDELAVVVWRVNVGRVPLYLLDTDLPENNTVGRWVTSRLYEGNGMVRLAQYATLGVGGMRALAALGIVPTVYHFNEGHPTLAAVAMYRDLVATGLTPEDAWQQVRSRIVFTTHTPVWAGNETYSPGDLLNMLGDIAVWAGGANAFLRLGRVHQDDDSERPGLSVVALRTSRSANGVSRRHGEVARGMWRELWPGRAEADVPITYVTNGVHVPTWMREPMRGLLDRYLGDGWLTRAADPATWAPVESIPDAELWAARNEARRRLVEEVRTKSASDRLRRGEPVDYAEAAAHSFRDDVLTIGFARRIASYKRLHLLTMDPGRALRFLEGPHPLQLLLAGKAHPLDDVAKGIVQRLFQLKSAPQVGSRVSFLEDYDLGLAPLVVSGCDVWVNVPRPPQEASGTSGMKAAMNGVLNLSVLDGWWTEAYDGTNGWAIDGSVDYDEGAQDVRHASELFDLLERKVVPLFHERGADGIPHGWVQMIKRSWLTIGPRFCATRMVLEYADRIYPPH